MSLTRRVAQLLASEIEPSATPQPTLSAQATGTSSMPLLTPADLKALTASEVATEQGLTRLARMAATRSLKRNLEVEDAAVKRETEAHQAEVWGDKAMTQAKSDDEMDIMAARDVVVRYENPQSPQRPPSDTPTWAKVGLVGLGLLGAGGIGATVANYFSKPSTNTTVTQPGQVFGVDVRDGLPK